MKFNVLIYRICAFLVLSFFISQSAFATHNRAGEIVYTQDPDVPFRIIATITTYTRTSSTPADRDSLELCWGDGTCEWILRTNGTGNPPQGEPLPNDIKLNFYTADHLYPGPGHYAMGMLDRNRNEGIINVNPPNSEQIEFFLSTTVTFRGGQFSDINNSPILLQPPIDIGCVGQRFIHNPNAFDVDGDSLVYEAITPQRDLGVDVPQYFFPNSIGGGGANNNYSVNPITGDIVWDSPQQAGEYNIAIYIIEFRGGVPRDTMIRDMQILILECENMPPEIESIDEICVIAGDVINLDVIATDPDIPVQMVELTALGGPFQVAISPATFNAEPGPQAQPNIAQFRWQTTCEHISSQFYTVVFRAVDDFPVQGNSTSGGLADLKTLRIKVVGPPPENVTATADEDIVIVNWDAPYECEDAADDYFRTFSVWRRIGSNQFPIDNCETGLIGKGYEAISFDTRELVNGRYEFIDNNVERGRTYCYRVLADFARISPGGFRFNLVESLPSNEACLQVNRDIPLIFNVDVDQTDSSNREMIVRWTRPAIPDLDTIANPGPYTYEVWRTSGFENTNLAPIPGSLVSSPTYSEATDTVFIDTGINTQDTPYTYAIAFTTGSSPEPQGVANTASSIFLTVTPSDEINTLTWEHEVPWDNFEYNIFRQSPGQTNFTNIGTVTEQTFIDDNNLRNGEEYCYFIEALGTYGVEEIASPLINRSQRTCGIPIDNIPPCAPELTITNICDDPNPDESLAFENNLLWTNPNEQCPDTDDVIEYEIFYTPIEGGEFASINVQGPADNTELIHTPADGIAGCYFVVAIDSVGNQSEPSNIVCVDNCPLYELPNAFTPNGDNANDLFIPFPYRFIESIDIKIYNQWGNLVHQNTDPDINWDGTNENNEILSDGVYFYVCRVFERRVSGVEVSPEILEGFIELRKGR